jgi:hypothetical protein
MDSYIASLEAQLADLQEKLEQAIKQSPMNKGGDQDNVEQQRIRENDMVSPGDVRPTLLGTNISAQSRDYQSTCQDRISSGQGVDFASYGEDLQPLTVQRDNLLRDLDQSTAELAYHDASAAMPMDAVSSDATFENYSILEPITNPLAASEAWTVDDMLYQPEYNQPLSHNYIYENDHNGIEWPVDGDQ